MTWSTRRFAIFCAPWIAVLTARSHSSIESISPKAMPRERVLAAPITRKAPWDSAGRPVAVAEVLGHELQHQAGDLGGADVEHGDDRRA